MISAAFCVASCATAPPPVPVNGQLCPTTATPPPHADAPMHIRALVVELNDALTDDALADCTMTPLYLPEGARIIARPELVSPPGMEISISPSDLPDDRRRLRLTPTWQDLPPGKILVVVVRQLGLAYLLAAQPAAPPSPPRAEDE